VSFSAVFWSNLMEIYGMTISAVLVTEGANNAQELIEV